MQRLRCLVLPMFVTLWASEPAVATPLDVASRLLQTDNDAFQQGYTLLDGGNTVGALDFWIERRDSISAARSEDPRIATAFVAAVADHGFALYEEVATDMFYWGFSVIDPDEEARQEILAEGRRTFALVDSATAEAWNAVGQIDPAALARAIKQFWLERDPTPTTAANERLLEHWTRITYAREHYTYNRNSAFDTDDRGVFYVKYGQPAQVTAGHLKVSTTEARWRGIEKEDLFRWDVDPQYEIWRYATLGEHDFTYFMFGNEEGTGPFRHVTGPHEILPRSARTGPGSRLPTGIRAQYYLELLYYIELARAGGPFGNRLSQLEALWNQTGGNPSEGYLEAMSLLHIDDDIARARTSRPPTWSAIDEAPKSALSAQAARIIQEGQPRVLAVAVSSPTWTPILEERELPKELVLGEYTPNHMAIARDHRLDEFLRVEMLPLDANGEFSHLVLRHDARIRHISIVARHDMDDATNSEGTSRVFPGSAHFAIAAPLSLDVAGFEVSDIMVGIPLQTESPLASSPVPLLPATRVWRDDLLRVYFEIYQPYATTSENQEKTYDVGLRLSPAAPRHQNQTHLRPSPRDEGDDNEGRAVVQVALSSEGPTGTHFFDLDLRNEASGTLHLLLEVTDPVVGITKTRVAVVELLDF